jgi:arylsulfatase A-like enzyme
VTPIHASILTSRPYRTSSARCSGDALPEEQRTLAELAAARGFATAGFVSAFPATRHYGLQQGFETWDQDFQSSRGAVVSERGVVDTGSAQRRADATTDRALAWLDGASDGPFFAWVHYFDVHDPVLLPPAEYLARFAPASASRVDRLHAIYDAELAFIDVRSEDCSIVWELGLRDRTIVVSSETTGGLGDTTGHGICTRSSFGCR